MLRLESDVRVYLYTRPCDMRKGFDTLSALAEKHFRLDVQSGGLFVFFSRKRDRVKILYWDLDGFAMWQKRLETGTFRVGIDQDTEVITGVDLELLLKGMELKRIRFRNRIATKGIEQQTAA